ncbi:MAG: alpha/beta fold hydrolase [Deltaproteobacteria bacterium]|nr:alpha/beta fold hydrolase [Deltaproteobacteria bacterium]
MGYAREKLPHECYAPDTGDGWLLDLCVFRDPEAFDPKLAPLVMIPGYGMNTHPLTYHPTGESLTEHLCGRGFEVWAANLRGQGRSARLSGRRRYGFPELALTDLPVTFQTVLERTKTEANTLTPIGCSLGASLVYAYLAHHRDDHPLQSMVAVGGPLRWDKIHPLLRVAFGSPRLVGSIPMAGTRKLAATAMPLIKRLPKLAAIYMNASIIDMEAADELVLTVEDPNPELNRQIASWVVKKDLVVEGVNASEALTGLELPILCILANADGIVTPEAALSVKKIVDHGSVELLEVGDDETWFAHADLFVSNHARAQVFEPLGHWLLGARN